MTPAQQERVIAEAMTWQNTRYHHAANIKGGGVDCVMLLVEVFKALEMIPQAFDPRPYTRDWHLHNEVELYLGGIEHLADPVDAAQPGDIALFQFGRCISHGALVLQWPLVLHAYYKEGFVVQTDISRNAALMQRLRAFYRIRTQT
jgi:cell wall-associated NlpC family hydrolase